MQSPDSNNNKDPHEVKCHIRAQYAPPPGKSYYFIIKEKLIVVQINKKMRTKRFFLNVTKSMKHDKTLILECANAIVLYSSNCLLANLL